MNRGQKLQHFQQPQAVPASGSITLKVTRGGNVAATALPYVLFLAASEGSSYSEQIRKNLPAGVAYDGLTYDQFGSAIFAFSEEVGETSGTVTISCDESPYRDVLENSKMDLLIFNRLKFSVPDVAQIDQADQALKLTESNIFGTGGDTPAVPSNFKNPGDFQNTQFFVPLSGPIDKNTGIVSKQITDRTSTIVFFFSKFLKYNADLLIG